MNPHYFDVGVPRCGVGPCVIEKCAFSEVSSVPTRDPSVVGGLQSIGAATSSYRRSLLRQTTGPCVQDLLVLDADDVDVVLVESEEAVLTEPTCQINDSVGGEIGS